ncbi:hypothetical protein BS47DRAFT_1296740, partial [Hydnum rufescens UP504]
QLIYRLHLEALNPCLPLVSRSLLAVLKAAPHSLRAQYLMACYPFHKVYSRNNGLALTIQSSLSHAMCDTMVIRAIHRLHALEPLRGGEIIELNIQLPKRLFRDLGPSLERQSRVIDTLRQLQSHRTIYRPNINSHRGYPLTMACRQGAVELMKVLLEMGADPGKQGALAVKVAIRLRNLAHVRMLVERTEAVCNHDPRCPSCRKRRKLEDRVIITPELVREAVKVDARDIVDYFVHVKGCSPTLRTLEQLVRGSSRPDNS